MIYPKKIIAIICAVTIFQAQISVSAYALAPNNTASQESNMIHDLYHAIDSGDQRGVEDFSARVKAMLNQSGVGKTYKVNFDFKDNNGDTPLIRAARQGRTNIVDYIFKQGANPNLVNKDGQTAMAAAAANGHYDIVKLLASKNVPMPLPVAQKMAQLEKNKTTAASNAQDANDTGLLIGVGGGIVLAGVIAGVAIGGGGGGSGTHSNSGGSSSPSLGANLVISCHPGSAPAPDDCNPTSFVTPEFNAMGGNAAMLDQYALARGYDGSIYSRNSNGTLVDELPHGHVLVAVVDSGVDLTHPELVGNIAANLSVTCSDSGCVSGGQDNGSLEPDNSIFYHGTAVAGIIAAERNGTTTGVQGIAPQANIISVSFNDASGNLTGGDVPGIKYALDNGAQVINASYGYGTPIVDAIDRSNSNAAVAGADPQSLRDFLTGTVAGTSYAEQFQHIVSSNAIIVYANGNSSYSQSQLLAGLPLYFQGANAPLGITQQNYNIVNPTGLDWSKNWVAAVALDSNNNIASYSNQCGAAMNWCLAAPGNILMALTKGGGYVTNVQGTSFAAPNITGAIAVMLGAFPQLTPEQVLQILFNTATDLGAAGVDPVYGHGLVNLQKATSPSDGGWTLSVHSSSQSQSQAQQPAANYDLVSSRLNLSPAFGGALMGKGLQVMFLDSYGKNYTIPLEAISGTLQSSEDSMTRLARFGYGVFSNRYDISNNSHLSYTMSGIEDEQQQLMPGYSQSNSMPNQLVNASYMTTLGTEKENVNVNFNYKTSVANVFGFSGLSDAASTDLSATGVYKNPYLNFSQDAKSAIVNYNHKGDGFTVGAYQGTQDDDNTYEFDGSDTGIRGVFMQYSYKNEYGLLSLTSGMNIEDKTLLGSESSGAFNLAGNSKTYFGGIGGKYNLSDKLSLLGNYNIGVTRASAASDSLFTNVGNIVSDSFSLGAEYVGINTNSDRVGFAVSQPLRVRNAPANLSLPSSINPDGSIIYSNNNVSLAATAHETDLETYYGIELSDKSKLALSGVYAINPDNTTQNSNEGLVMLKYSLELN